MQAQTTKSGLVAVFRDILEGDKDTLQRSQLFLQEASQHAGFTTKLVIILNDSSISVPVKQIALGYFSKHIKRNWKSRANNINSLDKEIVKRCIVDTIIECDRKLMRSQRELFALIIKNEYQKWPIIDLLVNQLLKEINLVALFNILLSISNSFEHSVHQDERSFFLGSLIILLPIMLNKVQKFRDKELIYLSIKFIWKALHLEISAEVKTLVCDWMPLIRQALGATNLEFDRLPEEVQQRHSQEFYYFHTKKWATRVFLLFVEKHAKLAVNARNNNRIFSDFRYANYSGQLITSLVNQMSIKTTNKIRCLQLKCLYILAIDRPELVEKYAEFLQYTVLSQLIRLQPEDQEIANTDPQQFIRKEQNEQERFEIVKTAAIETWAVFSELGMRNQRQQTFEPGVFFYQNISYIQSKLQSNDPLEKELGMRLMCRLHSSISRQTQTKRILPLLLAKYIIPQFKSPIMLIRARAADVLKQYGKQLLNDEIIKIAAQNIFACLTKNQHPLVCIKATFALEFLILHKTAKEFFCPFLKHIFSVCFRLLKKYQLENILNLLEEIIEAFRSQVSSFAVDIVINVHKAFLIFFEKDQQARQKQDYDGEAESAVEDCIKIIKQIIESHMPVQMVPQVESFVVSIAQVTFEGQGRRFIDGSMELLNAYIYKSNILSGEMWFYCQTVVFYIVGLQNNTRFTLDNLNLRQNQIALWKQANTQRILKMDESAQFMSNCIQKIAKMKHQPNFQTIKINFISLLFYLFENIYKFSAEPYSELNDITFCIKLMICTLENFQSTLHFQFYSQIWNYFKINLQLPQRRIKVVNSQLLALLIWAAPKQILTLAYLQNFICTVLRQITQYKQNYKNIKERSRVILGVSSLLQFAGESAEILEKIPQIIDLGLNLHQINAIERSNSRCIQFQSEEENNSDDSVDMILSSSGNLWDYNQDTKYNSPLTLINEQEEFVKATEKVFHLISQEDQARICQRFRILRNY